MEFYSNPWNSTTGLRVSLEIQKFHSNLGILLQVLGFSPDLGILLQTLEFYYRFQDFSQDLEISLNLGILLQVLRFLSRSRNFTQTLEFYYNRYWVSLQIQEFYSKPWNSTTDPRVSLKIQKFHSNLRILQQIKGFLSRSRNLTSNLGILHPGSL